jgi:hypothetical protein
MVEECEEFKQLLHAAPLFRSKLHIYGTQAVDPTDGVAFAVNLLIFPTRDL